MNTTKSRVLLVFGILAGNGLFAQNVGINTDGSAPGMMLDVKTSNATASDGIRINNPNTGNGDAILNFQLEGSSAFTLGIDDSDGDKFKIGTGGDVSSATKFTLQSDGRVGIGTDAPSTLLHIESANGGNMGLEAIRLVHDKWWANQTLDISFYSSLNQEGRIRSKLYTGGTASDMTFAVRSGGALTETLKLYDGEVTVPDLAGTGTATVEVDANGKLQRSTGGSSSSTATVSTNLHPSNDDMTKTNLRNTHGDDVVHTFSWGFNFEIDGTNYSSGWVNSNGVLGFGSNTSTTYTNTTLPASISTDPMLFFHWDDHSAQNIDYVVSGTTPGRVCTIYWKGNTSAGGGGTDMYVAISLYESSNVISVSYIGNNGWSDPTYQWGTNNESAGGSSTFGFQYAGGAGANTIPMGYNSRVINDNLRSGIPFISYDF